jgi:hypothetical protein
MFGLASRVPGGLSAIRTEPLHFRVLSGLPVIRPEPLDLDFLGPLLSALAMMQQLTATLPDSASDSTSLGWQGLG